MKMEACRYIQVVVNLPELPAERNFDYHIPEDWKLIPPLGSRVLVPFAGRRVEGIVWGNQEPTYAEKIKDVHGVLDETPILTVEQMSLIEWLAQRFFCRRQDLFRLFFPPGMKGKTEKCWRQAGTREKVVEYVNGLLLTDDLRRKLQAVLEELTAEYTPYPTVQPELKPSLVKMVSAGLIKVSWRPQKPVVTFKTVQAYGIDPACVQEEPDGLTAKQEKVWSFLGGQQELVATKEILAATGVTASVVEALARKGLLTKGSLVVERNPFLQPALSQPAPVLNDEQAEAFDQIEAAIDHELPGFFLLHGVTGSGKTEVYLQAIAAAMKRGKEAILLVPEIALTPQTVERVRSRFGEAVAVLHSSLSDGERFDQWWKIKNGEVKVVVGARSAVFAPLPNLGLIIIDEEHEFTYKQEEVPRYHAKEVAQELCRRVNGVLVLGSATPSLESIYAVQKGEIQKLTLSQRILGRAMPAIELVDLREEFKARRFTVLSPRLNQEIADRLVQGEQVIILLNRRGFATFIICRECGHVLKCPACDVTLTFHRNPAVLRCHYCNYQADPPERCPHCKSHYLRYFGHGTQRLEEELTDLFPQARIARMDLDTTGRKGSHERIYRQLVRQEIDILLGTQMVAKGLDLPNVTLVGILAADSGLNLPDFRAAERTYQILTQAAGRAGRGEKAGLVVIQTFNPEHYSIKALAEQEESAFYQQELAYRSAGSYPPFNYLIRLVFSGADQRVVMDSAQKVTTVLEKALTKLNITPATMEVLGPQPAIIEKIKNQFRWHTLIKTQDLTIAQRLLPKITGAFRSRNKGVRIIIDENPYSVL
jgi:primosomal protein N' (replication factor Y)